MKHSQDVLLKSMQAEKASLDSTLSAFSMNFKKEAAPVIPTRSQSNSKYAAELESKGKKTLYTMVQTTTAVRQVHEASRAQRDAEIINAGHKKLMLSCIKAAANRSEKLERAMQAVKETPQ